MERQVTYGGFDLKKNSEIEHKQLSQTPLSRAGKIDNFNLVKSDSRSSTIAKKRNKSAARTMELDEGPDTPMVTNNTSPL